MVTETVPVNTTFDAAASDARWVCAAGTCTLAVGTVAPAGFGSGTFAVRVDSPLPAGVTELANTVTIADDGANGPIRPGEQHRYGYDARDRGTGPDGDEVRWRGRRCPAGM